MRELSLHLLDIAENSVAAGADQISITVHQDSRTDRLALSVSDNGRGMDADMAARVIDPFVTSRSTRKVGLGIPLLKLAAEACNGSLVIHSKTGQGTRVDVDFQNSHIDRMPIGDLATTLLNVLIAYPNVRWIFNCRNDDSSFYFDSLPVIDELRGISFSEPAVLSFLRQLIQEGIEPLQFDQSLQTITFPSG